VRGWSHDRTGQVSPGAAGAGRPAGVEHQDEHASQWAAICSIAHKFGVLADDGLRPGLTSDERERLKALERENRELRRANEILKSAAAFFGAELDRRPSR
jgi:transposase